MTLMLDYQKTEKQTLSTLGTSKKGLTVDEARKRLKLYGPNRINVKGEPLWRKLIEPFANVFILVLLLAAAISVLHGDTLDAAIIGVIIGASAIIYYVQRFSTERILRALKKHDVQDVEAYRDNKQLRLPVEQLVPGDIIRLGEGERIPADCRILEADSLRSDESQLTGESEPITKQTGALAGEQEIYERSNMLFQGSFIVSGTALAVVTQTGNSTEFGRLASLTKNAAEASPVQKKIDKLLSQIIAVVAGLAIVAFALSQLRGMELTESLRFIIALSVSAVPESLPVAITIVLVLGMRRMAAKKALVRTMRAIETLGSITTIATDKTGTLTKNKLTVLRTWSPLNMPLVDNVALSLNQREGTLYDPLDHAFLTYANEQGVGTPKYNPAEVFPFDQAVAMSGNLWHQGSNYVLSLKGAPEHVINASDLTENEHEKISAMLHKLTGEGYRVIALAHADFKKPISSLPQVLKTTKLEFDGFVAVADILRPEAKQAIQTALKAGVTVRMITGDHFETAYHIGRQLGMVTRRDQVFDSRRMHIMGDEELEKVITDVRVFSRVIPEDKYRILSLLKKHNITAMTGDGVNDVPALTNAHVGVAMGSGAHIAKDAGDIILTDDNFKGIVEAMREGRTILANIRRMLYYLLATNTGEVLTMIGALVIGMPLPLLPVQILWINLVTDTSMVIPLGLEPGEKSNMTTKPLPPGAPILNKYLISRMVVIALTMASLTLGLYAFYSNQYGHDYGSTIAFSSLVVMQWASAFCARSEYQSLFSRLGVFNGKFYAGLAIGIFLQGLVLFGPLGALLQITPVAIGDLAITAAIGFIVPILFVELHKWYGRRFVAPRGASD